MKKVYSDSKSAIEGVKDGMLLCFGGFGLCGLPENSIAALRDSGVKNLTCVSNNAGVDGFGLGQLLEKRQIKKMVSSYVGENELFEKLYLSGELEVEFTPQGTLAEKMRAGGAGIPAFFTPTGVGTKVAEGKEERVFNGRKYILEASIRGDFSFVKAWKGDKFGNLIFRKTARNFNPLAAMAGNICVAEVEELVEIGELDPDQVHLSGAFVQRIFKGRFEKRIENITVTRGNEMPILTRDQIAQRISHEVQDGFVVNLGIGIPTMVANHIPEHIFVMFQSENGLLGMGPYPHKDEVDADLVNAGKQTITTVPGAAFFDSAESFAMIRGGHVDMAILGAMEVDMTGDLANWMVPGKLIKGMGGAMDLVAGAKRVIVAMQHREKTGDSKILKKCTLPLTGKRCFDLVVTDMAVLELTSEGFLLKEVAPGITVDEVKQASEAPLRVDANVREMPLK